ncbi:hypothetical protein VYU27_008359 [Nannochloropsis oceanica]
MLNGLKGNGQPRSWVLDGHIAVLSSPATIRKIIMVLDRWQNAVLYLPRASGVYCPAPSPTPTTPTLKPTLKTVRRWQEKELIDEMSVACVAR